MKKKTGLHGNVLCLPIAAEELAERTIIKMVMMMAMIMLMIMTTKLEIDCSVMNVVTGILYAMIYCE